MLCKNYLKLTNNLFYLLISLNNILIYSILLRKYKFIVTKYVYIYKIEILITWNVLRKKIYYNKKYII